MKESITKQRKWNLIAGGSDPANDVVSAELCQGIEDAMRHAYAKMKWLGRRKPGVRAHIIDPVMPPQPVSDTPRTDEISNASGNSWMNGNLCRQLERELNAANERIKLLEAVVNDPHALWTNWLRGNVKLPVGIGDVREYQDRIKRLEKAGEDLAVCGYFMGFEDELKPWRKALKDSQ